MVESAALLVDDVLRGYPNRQWVLSLPIPLRLLLARYPCELGKVMSIGRFQPILFNVQVLLINTLKRVVARLCL